MADPKKISQLTPAASVNANDYTVLVDGNNSTNKRATISQILASGVIGGTVTSVAATGSNGVGVSGGPITTSGTLNISLGAITPTSVAASGSVTGSNLSGTNTGDQTIQLVGDVEAAAGAPTLTTSIASGAVTNAKLANMTGPSLKGRVAAGVGAVSDLSAAQVATILPAVIGDSGSGGTQGLVPAPAAGDASAKKFLRADATWAAPAINDLLPSQSGQSGKVLKSDGTNVAWQADSGGSGTVTSVGLAGGTDITVSGSPVTTSGTITVGLTASGVGAGTYGSATQVPAITVDSKGRVTSAANTAIAIPSTAVSGLASVATTGAYSSLTGTPALGTISSQNSNNVNITGGSITGISALAVNSGGTGATSAVDARTNLGLGTIATQAANNVAITGGTMSNVQVSGLPTPVNASDAATKYYVDTFAQGLNPQAAVRAGTAGNITLSGLQTIDGVVLVASDRVLVKNQTNSAENGIYVAAAGAWSRAADANTAAELARGNYYMITEGTANIGDGWVIQTAPSNLGVDPVVFALFTNTVAAVSSISGTASQISASSSTGAITLSLPNTLVAPGTLTASGGITNTAIGASNPSTGAFTTLSASTSLSGGASGLSIEAGGTNQNITLTPSGSGGVVVNNNRNGASAFSLNNTSTGTGAFASVLVSNSAATTALYMFGTGYTTSGRYVQGSTLLDTNGAGGLAFGSQDGNVTWYMGGNNVAMRLSATNYNLLVGGTTDISGSGGLKVFGSTASTSTTSGALQVVGGVGVGGAINAGGNLTVSGTGTIGNQLKVSNASVPDLWLQNTSGATSAYRNILIRQNSDNTFKFLSTADNGVLARDNIITGSNDTGAIGIGVAPGAGVNSLTVAGNLTVSGGTITGGTSGMSLASGGTNQNITLTPSGTGIVQVNRSGAQVRIEDTQESGPATVRELMRLAVNASSESNPGSGGRVAFVSRWMSGPDYNTAGIQSRTFSGYGGGLQFLTKPTTGYAADGLVVAATINHNSNFLFGTTTDSGNGRIQLATHTTSAGGIGFGTDTSLYRDAAGSLTQYASSGNAQLLLNKAGASILKLLSDGSNNYIAATGGLYLQTNASTTALTLDSSQNATFANGLVVGKAASVNTITGGDSGAGTAIIQFKDGLGVTKINFIGDGKAVFSNTTDSTSTTTGALTVSGGVGVAKAGWFGGSLASVSSTNTGNQDIAVANYNTGATANSRLYAYNGSYQFVFELPSTGFTTSGQRVANRAYLWTDGAQGLTLHTLNGSMRFVTGNPGTVAGTIDSSQNWSLAGTITTAAPTSGTAKAWKLGEVATVSPTSPNRTIRVEIDGTVYYISAKTTND